MNSKRLTYRKLLASDFDLYYELYSNEKVMKYAYLDKFQSQESAKKDFEKVISHQNDKEKGTQFVSILKDTNENIGIVDYEVHALREDGGIFEIGYFIKPEYWGNGFATEMGKTIINYLFENYPIHKVCASCHCQNKKSEEIMKKIGMTKEGIIRKDRYKNNEWVDEIRYSVLKEEWLKK